MNTSDRPASLLDIDCLRTGDILFSSTADVVSVFIRSATGSTYSHASIYYENGVILESNDDGVAPKAISAVALGGSGLAGLPYDNWKSIEVLRLDHFAPEVWKAAIIRALRDHVGLDFPPPSALARGGPLWARALAFPFVKGYEAYLWLANREAMASDAWCSRLVGFVLAHLLAHKVTLGQSLALQRASPQRLYKIALELGYRPVTDCLTSEARPVGNDAEALRQAFLHEQDKTVQFWKDMYHTRRTQVRNDQGFKLLRKTTKLLQLLAVLALVAAIAAAIYYYSVGEVSASIGSRRDVYGRCIDSEIVIDNRSKKDALDIVVAFDVDYFTRQGSIAIDYGDEKDALIPPGQSTLFERRPYARIPYSMGLEVGILRIPRLQPGQLIHLHFAGESVVDWNRDPGLDAARRELLKAKEPSLMNKLRVISITQSDGAVAVKRTHPCPPT